MKTDKKIEELVNFASARRSQMGITQGQMAAKIFCNRVSLAKIECHETKPSLGMLISMLDVLGCDLVIKERDT